MFSSLPRRAAVAAMLTAGVVAVPLAASPAEAASDRTWNRLADCESGRRWHINTGNGYYGGLQFSFSTWHAYGGGKYRKYAHRAKRYNQVRIAERVLNNQGWGAWPSCSDKLNLTRKDAKGTPRSVRRH